MGNNELSCGSQRLNAPAADGSLRAVMVLAAAVVAAVAVVVAVAAAAVAVVAMVVAVAVAAVVAAVVAAAVAVAVAVFPPLMAAGSLSGRLTSALLLLVVSCNYSRDSAALRVRACVILFFLPLFSFLSSFSRSSLGLFLL